MISSLANFLMLILYRGLNQRVSWTLLMYTMGAVCVARIAIEQSRQYSIGYLAALALAAFVVMSRFVVGGVIFCAGILALIAYLSDRIVHDCTLIDESQDSSGQGLIDFGRGQLKRQFEDTESGNNPDSEIESTKEKQNANASQHKTGHQKTGHQPGRTVMYLAMAALPLFGLGQFLLRSDSATWSSAQKYLAVYLFSSLSLLVTTSFLGLRRYLRQRKVDMPNDVAVAWLAGGLVMIGMILGVAYLAPMPGQVLASIQMPEFLTAPKDLQASSMGWGDEGANEAPEDSSSTANDKQTKDKETQGIRQEKGAPPGKTPGGEGKQGPSGNKSGGNKSGGKNAGQKKSPSGKKDSSGSPQKSQSKKDAQQKSSKQQQGEQQRGQKNNEQKGSEQKSNPQESSKQRQASDQTKSADSKRDQDASKQSPQESADQNSTDQNKAQRSQTGEQLSEQKNEDSPSGEKRDNESKDSKPSEQKPNDKQDGDEANKSSQSDKKDSEQPDSEQSRDKNSTASQSNAGEPPPSKPSSSSSFMGSFFSALGGLLRFLVMAGLLAVVVAFVYLYRDALAAWWDGLWNREPAAPESIAKTEKQSGEPETPPLPFSSFRNPIGREKDPRKIVVVTFQAFEAWTREQGWQRNQEETPSEFIRRVAGSIPTAATPATQIVDAYNRIVYGRGKATRRDLTAAKQVWQAMQS